MRRVCPSLSAAAVALLLLVLLAAPGVAENEAAPEGEDSQKYTAEELEGIVGPVALYPDVVLASLLPASTATVDIVMASRLLEKQGDTPLEELPEEAKGWDPGVQALLQYPDILKWMNENLTWVEQLGYAVSVQQDEVLEAIQAFRRKTKESGNLESNDKIKVSEQPVEETASEDGTTQSSAIVIESADPQTVYVPSYDPYQVTQPYYGSRPLYDFGTGVAVGAVGAWAFHEIFWGGRRHHNSINISNNWHAWGRPRPPIHGPGFRPWRPGRPPRPLRPGFNPGRPGLRPPLIRPGRPIWRPGPGGIGGPGLGLRPPPALGPGLGGLPGRPDLGGGFPGRPNRPIMPGGPGFGFGGPARPGIAPLPSRPAPGLPGRLGLGRLPTAGPLARDAGFRGAQSLGARIGGRPLLGGRRPGGLAAPRPKWSGGRRPGGLLGGNRPRGGLLGSRGKGLFARPNAARGLGSLGGRRGGGLFGGGRPGGLLGGGRRGGGLLGGGRRGGGLLGGGRRGGGLLGGGRRGGGLLGGGGLFR